MQSTNECRDEILLIDYGKPSGRLHYQNASEIDWGCVVGASRQANSNYASLVIGRTRDLRVRRGTKLLSRPAGGAKSRRLRGSGIGRGRRVCPSAGSGSGRGDGRGMSGYLVRLAKASLSIAKLLAEGGRSEGGKAICRPRAALAGGRALPVWVRPNYKVVFGPLSPNSANVDVES
jgi:hypothetical protein